MYTDNNPLMYIHKSLEVDATSQRWLVALGKYVFSIHYKPGTLNIDTDILSRLHEKSTDISESTHINDIVVDPDVAWINYVDITELNPTNLGEINIMKTATQWLEYQIEKVNPNHIRQLLKLLVILNLETSLLTIGVCFTIMIFYSLTIMMC